MKIYYKTKISIKFANGNSMAFLGQGYIASGDKKVFVRLYTTSDLRRVVVKIVVHFYLNSARESITQSLMRPRRNYTLHHSVV